MLQKAYAMQNVDTVAFDLEDSVAPHMKPEARHNLTALLSSKERPQGIKEMGVRINSVDTGLALDDLTQVLKGPHLDAILVPKCESAADLHFVTDVVRHMLPDRHPANMVQKEGQKAPIAIIALIESAKSIQNLPEICKASPYLSGLVFAAEDFAKDMSITRTPSLTEFLYARSAIATAARAARLPSTIDLVCTSYKGDAGLKTLEEECLNGKGLGFNGKQCIHPSQIEVCQRAFAPGEKEVEWATRVLVGDEKASEEGRGAWTLDGMMIDAPVVNKSKRVLERAELCEIDVQAVREKWKDQEPE
jgi:citrate lyase subunit beta-like protein